ncbi:MAG: hypothetical protein PHQ47_01300 [Candidatus Portnoybacteria bacterium]|nr:hypothetical protein [Candidatus Portnoybacteria bacterium]
MRRFRFPDPIFSEEVFRQIIENLIEERGYTAEEARERAAEIARKAKRKKALAAIKKSKEKGTLGVFFKK